MKNWDVFNGIGCSPDTCDCGLVKDDAIPKACPSRRVPFKIKGKLKEALDKLVKDRVIVPVDEPCPTINSLVIVGKPESSLRLCIDPNTWLSIKRLLKTVKII